MRNTAVAKDRDFCGVIIRLRPVLYYYILRFFSSRHRDVPSLSPKRSTFTGRQPAEGSKPPAMCLNWVQFLLPPRGGNRGLCVTKQPSLGSKSS